MIHLLCRQVCMIWIGVREISPNPPVCVAQLVEHSTLNRNVAGSIPATYTPHPTRLDRESGFSHSDDWF